MLASCNCHQLPLVTLHKEMLRESAHEHKLQVNNKATVMISTLVGDGVHERIILPEFPYLTDENGGARTRLLPRLMQCS